jgi:hypothetical protein
VHASARTKWSPRSAPAEWARCIAPTIRGICFGNSLISPDGKTERSLPHHESAHYTFSKDGKLLYGLREDHGKQTFFSIDIASGAERLIGSGNPFAPGSYLSPSVHLSLAPDGKSLTYASGVIRSSLWLLEGFNPPDNLASRFGRRR